MEQTSQLLGRFIEACGIEPGTENFGLALEFATANCATHTFGAPSSREVERRAEALAEKLSVHQHGARAERLRELVARFLGAEGEASGARMRHRIARADADRATAFWSQRHATVLLLLLLCLLYTSPSPRD